MIPDIDLGEIGDESANRYNHLHRPDSAQRLLQLHVDLIQSGQSRMRA